MLLHVYKTNLFFVQTSHKKKGYLLVRTTLA